MFCTNCGAELPDDTQFCTQCGTPLKENWASSNPVPNPNPPATPIPASSGTPIAPQPSNNHKKALIVGAIILAVVVVVLIAFLLLNPSSTSPDAQEPTSTSKIDEPIQETLEEPANTTEPQVFEIGPMRIEMPAEYVGQGFLWTPRDQYTSLADSKGNVIASLVWGEAANYENESLDNFYGLGARETALVSLCIPLWKSEGSGIYAGKPTPGTPALEYVDITVDEIVSWITFIDGVRPAPAKIISEYINPHSTSNANSSENLSTTETTTQRAAAGNAPFYGVWIGAFFTQGEADSFAAEARNKNLPAEVYISSDWTNLNPQTYYVISVGHASSESEAAGNLSKAQAACYTDAYVKYSGEHR